MIYWTIKKREKINHSLQSSLINLATTAEMKVEQIGFSFVTKLKVVFILFILFKSVNRINAMCPEFLSCVTSMLVVAGSGGRGGGRS